MTARIPHPFPYQGSKRKIASHILPFIPRDTETLFEPFCGSAAVSIAAAANGLASKFGLNDIDASLMDLWYWILARPLPLAQRYERLWYAQQLGRKEFFYQIRDQFNSAPEPHLLLYLLARIVKGSIRYSLDGKFNQSPDNRRLGMRPMTMKKQLASVSGLLSGRTSLSKVDFREVAERATTRDVLYMDPYMDPPYQGTSFKRDHRYYHGLCYEEFVEALSRMNDRQLSFVVSYDGRTGYKQHGRRLPESLQLTHLYISAGRSSQATLMGSNQETVESLYLSPALLRRSKESGNDFAQALLVSAGLKTI